LFDLFGFCIIIYIIIIINDSACVGVGIEGSGGCIAVVCLVAKGGKDGGVGAHVATL
jgi:hypothetical protein